MNALLRQALLVVSHVMRKCILTIPVCFILFSCTTSASKEVQALSKRDSIILDSKIRDYTHFNSLAGDIGLLPIIKSVDSFELRVWVTSMLRENFVMVLRNNRIAWETFGIKYSKMPDGSIRYIKVNFTPDISANALADSLRGINFNGIISQIDIPGFIDNVADGITYNLEVATPAMYKLVIYHCPEHYAQSEKNNREFLNLIYLLDKHFKFYSPICVF